MTATSSGAPLISVIMPTYNGANTLAYAIESILNQTHANFELIIVDNASIDATREVLALYESRYPRVKVISNTTNLLAGPARNAALEIARGSLIAYLDDDNIWDRRFLEVMSRQFTDEAILMAYCTSRNHYRNREQYERVVKNDRREPVETNDAEMTAVFSHRDLTGEAGIDWYVDTNEIMHRAGILGGMRPLWAAGHPEDAKITRGQEGVRAIRTHEDLELVERVIKAHGTSALRQVADTLVEFFYSNNQSACYPLRHEGKVREILQRNPSPGRHGSACHL